MFALDSYLSDYYLSISVRIESWKTERATNRVWIGVRKYKGPQRMNIQGKP